MEQQRFLNLLSSLQSLTPDQVCILHKSLPEPDTLTLKPGVSQTLEALNERFQTAPYCPRCHSENVGGWGTQNGYPRYKCKDCKKTFNAMSCTPLAHLRARDKLDQYLECMQGKTTLRVAAEQCDVSLPTSFSLRHRIMRVIQNDKAELFRGITEIDETFFLENHKGQRNLGEQARKRGKRKACGKKGPNNPSAQDVKKVPVMVACDRQNHVTDAVLEHVSSDELEANLSGRIQPGAVLCADAHLSHESLASRLGLNLKELVTTKGEFIIDGIYHIQHVNAYHSDLKSWINGFFNGVATKYLDRYLGWKRFLKTEKFSADGLLERISGHWLKLLLC